MSERFPAFEKIATSPAEWDLCPSARRPLDRARWVVTEKIHGANFSWIFDGVTLSCAKRKAPLPPGASFFGHERLFDDTASAIRDCARGVLADHEGLAEVWIRGELFGGGYPHPDVPPALDISPVQTGVWYCPQLVFCAFDIEWVDRSGARGYLRFEDAHQRAIEAGLMFTKPLFYGSFTEAIQFSPVFQSKIYKEFGLPIIDDNFAEGIVLKPIENIVINTKNGLKRPLLKIKNPRFEEDDRYHQAKKTNYSKNDNNYQLPALDLLEWAGFNLINENRVASAISKVGRSSNEVNQVIDLVIEDIFEIYQRDYPQEITSLSEDEAHLLVSLLSDEIKRFLPYPLGEIDRD
ncbi:hypothetical protein KKF91_17105 [Myxococcota bacterium]|nr:hypothetical protein [Myxococcota bacterium]MBU1432258.1 hypothetical protein [Myxococcota bacterium]MBU1897801.1 hypothetical protein [Myxococcota bacterium]